MKKNLNIFIFAILFLVTSSVFLIPDYLFAQQIPISASSSPQNSNFVFSPREIPPPDKSSTDLKYQSFTPQVPLLYITNIILEKDHVNAGEILAGTTTVFNNSNFDAPSVKLVLSIVEHDSTLASSTTILGRYGEKILENTIFLRGHEQREVGFSYVVPKTAGSGKGLRLSVLSVLDSGVPRGAKEIPISISGLSKPILVVNNVSVEVKGIKYSSQQGPTVYAGDQATTTLIFSGIKEKINVTPKISIHKLSPVGEKVFEQTFDPVILTSKNKIINIPLPISNIASGVYSVSVDLLSEEGSNVTDTVFVRYIIGGSIVNIENVAIDNLRVEKKESINVNLTFSSSPFDIVRGEIPKVGMVDVSVSLIDSNGIVIAEGIKQVNLDNINNLTTQLASVKSGLISKAEVTVLKDGKEIAHHITPFDGFKVPENEKKPLNIYIIIISVLIVLILIIVASLWFFKKKSNLGVAICILGVGLSVASLIFLNDVKQVHAQYPGGAAVSSGWWGWPDTTLIPYVYPNIGGDTLFGHGQWLYFSGAIYLNVCLNAANDVYATINVYDEYWNLTYQNYALLISSGQGSHEIVWWGTGFGFWIPAPTYGKVFYVDVIGTDYANGVSDDGSTWGWEIDGYTRTRLRLPLPAVNGSCGGTNNSCGAGTLSDTADSSSQYLWNCIGSNGGSNAPCSLNKPINGSCGGTNNSCSAGTLSDTADSSSQYLWSCLGLYGGTNSPQCSLSKVTAPVIPSNFVLNVSGSSCSAGGINLSWSPVTDATSYNVYRSLTSSGTYSKIASALTSTNYTDNNSLASGTIYYYKISASNSGGESGLSSSVRSNSCSCSNGAIDPPACATCDTANGQYYIPNVGCAYKSSSSVGISVFSIVSNLINVGGSCDLSWTLTPNPPDASSTCSIYKGSALINSFDPSSANGTYTGTGTKNITNETTYKLSCWEKNAPTVVVSKYTTCNINPISKEVNP